ncbi:MAG: hypothetical protein E7050_07600 [Lentisphaerae bacterium]|nr:hypothetical protein [Lentisphaerota bacterium]
MVETRDFIISGISDFKEKYKLAWQDITIVTAGDILTTLMEHKVLYSDNNWDYAVYVPCSVAEAEKIADEFAPLGANVCHARKFKERVFLAVYSPKTTAPAGPLPDLLADAPWKSPFGERKVLDSAAAPGELSPFTFKGENYRLENVLAHYTNPKLKVLDRWHENYFCIRREADDRLISIPLIDHYFASAYVWNDRCYCYSMNQGASNGQKLEVIWSDDLITWSAPHCIFDYTAKNEHFCNTSVTTDGKKFYLLFESNDHDCPVYTFHFAESEDLIHWTPIPGAVYADDKYTGGGSLHYVAEDKLFYLSTLDLFIHPVARKVCYRFIISRSPDLIHWEDAPYDRPLLLPDCSHQPDPERHPEVFEISVSDMEYRVDGDKVIVYFIGGNQWGVCDNQITEYHGKLADLFRSFFK